MVRNRIKTRREAVGIRQAELAAHLRDVTAAAVLSGIESGYAMPTRTDMGILCEVLRCAPEDLYDADALDLTGRNASSAKPGKRRNNTEIRVRIDPQDKRELAEAVAYLGYRDLSEWLQRMRRDTVRKYRARLEMAAKIASEREAATGPTSSLWELKTALNGSGEGNEKAGDDAATSNSRQTNNSKVSIAHPGANVKGVRA